MLANIVRVGSTALVAAVLVCATPPAHGCVGDCDGNFEVAINELVRGVNVLLETAPLETCEAIDNNVDGAAMVNELVLAVNRTLNGCYRPPAGERLFSPQANQLDVYNLSDGTRDLFVPSSHGTLNGEVCLLPDDSGRFVLGDDTGQPEVRPGWGIYSPDGTFLQKLTLPPMEGETRTPDPLGCAFDESGRLFTTAIVSQAGEDGWLMVFFPPTYTEACILATNLRTPGTMAEENGSIYVPEATPPGRVLRFDPPFPNSPEECDTVALNRSVFIDYAPQTLASFGIARAPGGNWYVSSVVNFTPGSGPTIKEHDASGAFVRDLIQGDVGNPAGLSVASDGTIYYADLGLSDEFMTIPGGASVRRVTFDTSGNPNPPEIVGRGLTFADSVKVLPVRPPESLMYGGSLRHTFYNRFERQITRETVGDLVPKWRYYTGGIITASPAVAWIDLPQEGPTQLAFVPSWDGNLYALRVENGTRVWTHTFKPQPGASYPNASSPTVAWLDGRPVVYAAAGMTMYGIDAVTGERIWEFDGGTGCTTCGFNPNDPSTRERNEILSSPAVYNGRVYFGIDMDDGGRAKGGFFAVDATDGRLVWYFDLVTGSTCRPGPEDNIRRFDGYHTAEQLGLPEDFFATREGCNFDRTGTTCGNVWSSASLDARRGYLYFASSNCDTDDNPATPEAPPPMPPYDEALTALRLDGTPAWVWRPREVDNDDLAFGGVPNLFEVEIEGEVREVVGIGNKDGTYYLLDRDGTNEITNQIEPYWQTKVIAGGAIGGIISSASVGEGKIMFSTGIGEEIENLQKPAAWALNAATGAELWHHPDALPSFGPTSGIPGLAFMGELATGMYHAYNTDTGERVKALDAKGQPGGVAALAAIVGGQLLVGGGTGARGGRPAEQGFVSSDFDTPLSLFCVVGTPGCEEASCDDENVCTFDYRDDDGCQSEPAPDTLDCPLGDEVIGRCNAGECLPIPQP